MTKKILGFLFTAILFLALFGCSNSNSNEEAVKGSHTLFSANGLVNVDDGISAGYMDKDGKEVLPMQYDSAQRFSSSGLALVRIDDDKQIVIDDKGNTLFEQHHHNDLGSMDDNGNSVGFDDYLGFCVASDRYATDDYEDNTKYKYGNWMGYLDSKGEWAIGPQFSNAYPFTKNGLARVSVSHGTSTDDDDWGYIDKKGNFVISPQFDYALDFSDDGLAAVRNPNQPYNWGYVSENGELTVPYRFDEARKFKSGYAAVRVNDKWGFIDKKGNYIVEPKLSAAGSFADNGLAPVCLNGKWGYINTSEEMVLEPECFCIGSFSSVGLAAVVTTDNLVGYIDDSGTFVIEPEFYGGDWAAQGISIIPIYDPQNLVAYDEDKETFQFYDDGYAIVSTVDGFGVGVIDTKGNLIIPSDYDAINNVSPR